jgi:hypothetical protein
LTKINKKMKKIILAIVAVFSIAVYSCSKDQKVVKQLEGDWKVSARTVNGVAEPAASYASTVYTFTTCKVKKGDCDGTLTEADSTKGTVSTPFKYSISDKGEKIKISLSFFGITTSITGDIKEHSSTKFVYTYKDDNETFEETLVKK